MKFLKICCSLETKSLVLCNSLKTTLKRKYTLWLLTMLKDQFKIFFKIVVKSIYCKSFRASWQKWKKQIIPLKIGFLTLFAWFSVFKCDQSSSNHKDVQYKSNCWFWKLSLKQMLFSLRVAVKQVDTVSSDLVPLTLVKSFLILIFQIRLWTAVVWIMNFILTDNQNCLDIFKFVYD